MKKFGLIGSGISGSLSPALFKAAYAGAFSYELLDGENWDILLEKAKKEYDAVNVTSPFKENALESAAGASEEALLCGAANMLIKAQDGSFYADNSDFEGVTLSILSGYTIAGIDVDDEDSLDEYVSGKRALIVGCGGAGKAAAAAALALGYGTTVLMNRTRAKADALKKHLSDFFGDIAENELVVAGISEFEQQFKKADIIIYTAPCAVWDGAMPDFGQADKNKFILEANYTSPCLEALSDKFTYLSGLNWLMNQAIVSYEAFTGMQPDQEQMRKNILK